MLTPSEAELANMSASLIVWRGSNTYWMKPCHFQETVTSSDLQNVVPTMRTCDSLYVGNLFVVTGMTVISVHSKNNDICSGSYYHY